MSDPTTTAGASLLAHGRAMYRTQWADIDMTNLVRAIEREAKEQESRRADEAEAIAHDLAEALDNYRHGPGCYCPHGWDDPMTPEHTGYCKQSRAALTRYRATRQPHDDRVVPGVCCARWNATDPYEVCIKVIGHKGLHGSEWPASEVTEWPWPVEELREQNRRRMATRKHPPEIDAITVALAPDQFDNDDGGRP